MAPERLLLFTILCSVLSAGTPLDIRKKKIVVRSVGQCRGDEHLRLYWHGFVIKPDSMSIKLRVKEEVSDDFSIRLNFWKCDASGNPDSCEQVLRDFEVKNACTHIVRKNQAWTDFMEGFDRPLMCPIKPGEYEAKNVPTDGIILKYMPVSDALWKARFEAYDRGKRVSCVHLELLITPFYRRRN